MDTKTCSRCGENQPLDDFYKHAGMRDGHSNQCKECEKRDSSHRYHEKAKDVEWLQKRRARGVVLSRRWMDANKERSRETRRVWRNRNPQKAHARGILRQAVLSGGVVKSSQCERCGIQPKSKDLHGHHPDYNKPLDVEWICRACHKAKHRVA